MISLARKTLRHEWRRFLPAALAVGFSSLLLLMQAALVLGIFGSAAVPVTGSSADVWVGYPGTRSVDQGRPIDSNISARLHMDPSITRVEPFIWLDGDWRGERSTGGVSVFVSGISTDPDSMLYSRVLSRELRARLLTPDTVLVDRSDLDKLGTRPGGRGYLNGRRVRIVGVMRGMRALGGVNIVSSIDTARRMSSDRPPQDWPTYLVASVRGPATARDVTRRLGRRDGFGFYEAWTADEFARRSILFWLFDTGAGAGVLFLAAIVFTAGAVISSQSLVAAVVGSAREYATLNALGVGFGALSWIVLEQAFWIGMTGAFGAIAGGASLIAMARLRDVPVVFNLQISMLCLTAVLGLVAVAGVAALNGLRRADPTVLLR